MGDSTLVGSLGAEFERFSLDLFTAFVLETATGVPAVDDTLALVLSLSEYFERSKFDTLSLTEGEEVSASPLVRLSLEEVVREDMQVTVVLNDELPLAEEGARKLSDALLWGVTRGNVFTGDNSPEEESWTCSQRLLRASGDGVPVGLEAW